MRSLLIVLAWFGSGFLLTGFIADTVATWHEVQIVPQGTFTPPPALPAPSFGPSLAQAGVRQLR